MNLEQMDKENIKSSFETIAIRNSKNFVLL